MSEVVTVTINEHGHIRLPAPVMRRLGLKAGSTLVVDADDDAAHITEANRETIGLNEVEGLLFFNAEPLADLTRAVDASRHQRLTSIQTSSEG